MEENGPRGIPGGRFVIPWLDFWLERPVSASRGGPRWALPVRRSPHAGSGPFAHSLPGGPTPGGRGRPDAAAPSGGPPARGGRVGPRGPESCGSECAVPTPRADRPGAADRPRPCGWTHPPAVVPPAFRLPHAIVSVEVAIPERERPPERPLSGAAYQNDTQIRGNPDFLPALSGSAGAPGRRERRRWSPSSTSFGPVSETATTVANPPAKREEAARRHGSKGRAPAAAERPRGAR